MCLSRTLRIVVILWRAAAHHEHSTQLVRMRLQRDEVHVEHHAPRYARTDLSAHATDYEFIQRWMRKCVFLLVTRVDTQRLSVASICTCRAHTFKHMTVVQYEVRALRACAYELRREVRLVCGAFFRMLVL